MCPMSWIRAWLARTTPEARVGIGLAVVLLPLVAIGSEEQLAEGEATRTLDAASFGLLAAAGLCMLASIRFPGSAVVAMMGLVALWYGMEHTSGLINPPVLVVFYQLGATGDRRRQFGLGLPAVALPLVWWLTSDAPIREELTGGDWPIDAVGWPVAAIFLGELVRNRRLLLDEYAERATTAEAEREVEAERRVAQERLRIARDLHDVLAHTVSVMNVQAGVAVDTLDRDPEVARASMENIRAAGREAMTEVRATISVLREGESPAGMATQVGAGSNRNGDLVDALSAQGSKVKQPAPGIDRIGELVEAVRTQGLSVELAMELGAGADDAERQKLDNLVELTAYRVVQEGLTNVTRHAHASHVDVRLIQGSSELVVSVSDDGTPTRADARGIGFGMKGMRERIEPLGGTLRYGPRDDGGWAVVATLPTRKARK